ncbi:glycogen/starch/alpha-glucan phosphorylase [Microcoleus sp. FACHB-1515]|uniref:glycogen/starch/alpha-glucan phosphorylase n=1 Tax=Cyanophyceae TaxID=3028117 RepID=UPI001687DCCD|nr:glycogen/starch/alpha-glucan phosphorylase [Microcoleus sp. FACHB-1515]MBD2093500.1 glycogen/starch/alpha-glucan phosphorylase [Microcoleus sp. FACHB-1515]
MPPLLEISLMNLDVLDRTSHELGLDLEALFRREESQIQDETGLSSLITDYLEALAASEVPAIGYGICTPSSEISDAWQIEHSEAIVKVGFGGNTQLRGGEQGYRTRWLPSEQIEVVPYDVFIPGYRSNGISILRQWKVNLPVERVKTLESNEENSLKQHFILASSSVQDIIRLHLAFGAAIETLHERFILHLNDATSALAIVELMRLLLDEYALEWQQAWRTTQTIFSCTVHHLELTLNNHWSIATLGRLLPRHLELIYEINRRFLAEVEAKHQNDIDRIRRMSLISETEARSLRTAHLICVSSHTVNSISTVQTRLLQHALVDFEQHDCIKFKTAVNGISSRRYLLRSNTRLANLLTQRIGETWITSPQAFDRLEALSSDNQFCSNWWQVKRDNKQAFASEIYQQTGFVINLNSLFDVQAAPIHENQRQLLNLLHIITLYARLKINSNTDTIQRFTHRSVPRTCIFSEQVVSDRPIAQFINRLIQSIATIINDDADVQGRLQVIVLNEKQNYLRPLLYAVADLSEQIPLATQADFSLNALRFSLNGASTIATQTPNNLQLQQTIGAKSVFLFGLTASDAEQLSLKSHDPRHYYSSDPELRQAIDLIASGYFSYKDSSVFSSLIDWLLSDDPNLILADYRSYIDCQERVSKLYQDQKTWTRNAISTTAHMHPLCADRAISKYQDSLLT